MTLWPTALCHTNGTHLHTLRTGGPKPPLLLLHGLTGNGACWTPLARALETDYDVVMPDARGHGASGTPPHGYSYEDHAADVEALIETLKLRTPVLLGHSMGGMTAALVASRAGAAIRGVVLADPTFLEPRRQREVYESDVAAQHRAFLALSREEALAQARARHPRRAGEMIERVIDARMRTRLEAFEVLAPPNPDYRALVAAIRAPVLLVIAGEGVVAMETAQELREITPRLRLALIRDAGHGVHYDQPERFAAVVGEFLRSLQ